MSAIELFRLQDLATEVGRGAGSTDDTTLESAKKWINRALIKMNALGEWPFLKDLGTTTIITDSGNNEYFVDPVIRKISSLYMRDPARKLFLADERQFRRAIADETSSVGSPTHYFLAGYDGSGKSLKVKLWPFPDGEYTIYVDGTTHIPLLENDEDDIREISHLPEHLVPIVIDLAVATGLKELDDSEASNKMQEVMSELAALYAEETTEIDDDIQFRQIGEIDLSRLLDRVLPPEYGD